MPLRHLPVVISHGQLDFHPSKLFLWAISSDDLEQFAEDQ
jgi:hypothetical protein